MVVLQSTQGQSWSQAGELEPWSGEDWGTFWNEKT